MRFGPAVCGGGCRGCASVTRAARVRDEVRRRCGSIACIAGETQGPARPWWPASVSPRRPVVNPVRAGRQQRQRRCRVPELKLVRAASTRPTRIKDLHELHRTGAQMAPEELLRAHRAGARAARAGECARQRARAPRVPVHRHARGGQDHHRAHPRQVPQLRDRRDARRRAACARAAARSMRAASSI